MKQDKETLPPLLWLFNGRFPAFDNSGCCYRIHSTVRSHNETSSRWENSQKPWHVKLYMYNCFVWKGQSLSEYTVHPNNNNVCLTSIKMFPPFSLPFSTLPTCLGPPIFPHPVYWNPTPHTIALRMFFFFFLTPTSNRPSPWCSYFYGKGWGGCPAIILVFNRMQW